MAQVGFVGLGVMGSRVVTRLLGAGHDVAGYNRTAGKALALAPLGLRVLDSPRAVAEASDVVFSMVSDSTALAAVTDGPDGILAGLAPGAVYVDMTTGTPDASRALAGRVAVLGAQLLEAPVSGSVSTLEEGRLSIMVGGDPDAYRRIEPILRDVGGTVRRIGGNGDALLMKIAINLSLQVQMAAFCEGVLLAEKAGIDRGVAVEAMLGSVIASPMLRYRGPFVVEQPDEAWFSVELMQKDMNLALDLGRRLDAPMPTASVANELLTAARGLGHGGRDFAIVYDVLAHMAGLEEVRT